MTAAGVFGVVEDANAAAGLAGGGAVVTLMGVSMLSPRLVRPLASVAGWPLERLRGITGRLARENSVRKPGRTAVTAGALMIGLAVVVFVTVFAAGISASVGNAIDRNFQGDLVLQNSDGFSPISAGAGREAERVEGVRTVSSLSFAGAERQGKDVPRVRGRSGERRPTCSRSIGRRARPPRSRGSPRHGAVADDAWAKSNDLAVGDRLSMRTPLERRATFTIEGTVKDNADLLGNIVVPEQTLRREFGITQPSITFVRLEPGAKRRRRAAGDQADRRPALPHRRHAQPAGAEGQPGGADQPAGGVLLRAAWRWRS